MARKYHKTLLVLIVAWHCLTRVENVAPPIIANHNSYLTISTIEPLIHQRCIAHVSLNIGIITNYSVRSMHRRVCDRSRLYVYIMSVYMYHIYTSQNIGCL